MKRLSSLVDLSGPALTPEYRREDHKSGIVHLGIGAFHRAHQAVMTDDAIAKHGGDWRIIGVSLRSRALAQQLNEQSGLYTLLERAPSGTSARVVGAIDRVIAADATATLEALCAASIRVVTLTVTEKGYGVDRGTGLPDRSDTVVAADLKQPESPEGVLGLLVAAIKRRRDDALPPLTLLSCDNLPNNGALLRGGVIGFARLVGNDELADWIDENIAFPSSMVDRITPASTPETFQEAARQTGCEDTAAVETEPFLQWVIEDKFVSGRPNWEAGGALFVDDVAPFEKMKLTMLNGAHSMIAYAGFLCGRKYVRDVMNDPDLSLLVDQHLKAASALLDPLPQIDYLDYAQALLARFSNPLIAHETYQIASDGSQKLPQRIFTPALNALDAGLSVRPFAFAAAMWMRYCAGRRDDGTVYELRDPRAEELSRAADAAGASAEALVDAFNNLPQLIPSRLKQDPIWRAELERVLSVALSDNCLAAVTRQVAA